MPVRANRIAHVGIDLNQSPTCGDSTRITQGLSLSIFPDLPKLDADRLTALRNSPCARFIPRGRIHKIGSYRYYFDSRVSMVFLKLPVALGHHRLGAGAVER